MSKKTGLGDNPLDWIKNTGSAVENEKKEKPEKVSNFKTSEVENLQTLKVQKLQSSDNQKFRTFEVKLSILLRADQLEFLEKFVREIMSNRESIYKRERITKNTIIRSYIDALKEFNLDKKNIPDEENLLRRIKDRMKEATQ